MKATRKLVMLGAVAIAASTVFAVRPRTTVEEKSVPIDNLGGEAGSLTEVKYVIEVTTGSMPKVTSLDPMVIEVLPKKSGFIFGGYWTEPDGHGSMVYDETGKMVLEDPYQLDIWSHLYEAISYCPHPGLYLYPFWRSKVILKFDFDGGTSNVDRVEVMTGEPLPPVRVPIKKGYAFIGYRDDERTYYDFYGRGVFEWDQSITSRTVKAYWTTAPDGQGIDLQEQINSAPYGKEVEIHLSSPIVDLKKPLIIPAGKDIHLSGFWIGRAALDWTPVCSGEVFRVLGKLTLKGITVFGGNTIGNGGGILIGKKGELRLCNAAVVCMNRATMAGGGIFGEKYSCIFLGDGFSIKDNMATVGSDVEMPCGSIRICSDANRESEEWNSLTPYSPGMMLLFK